MNDDEKRAYLNAKPTDEAKRAFLTGNKPWYSDLSAEQVQGIAGANIGGMPAQPPAMPQPAQAADLVPDPKYIPAATAALAAPFTGGMSIPAAVGTMGLMTAGGEGVRQVLEHTAGRGPQTSTEAAERLGKEFLLGAGPEVVFRGGGKFAARMALGKMTPEAQEAFRLAKESGLPISSTAFRDTNRARVYEYVAGFMPAGRAVQKGYQKAVSNRMGGIADELANTLGANKPNLDVSDALVTGIREALDGAQYKLLNQFLDDSGRVNLKATYNYINSMGKDRYLAVTGLADQSNESANQVKRFINLLMANEGNMSGADVRRTLPRLWKTKGYELEDSEKAIMGFKDSMLSDLDQVVIGSKYPRTPTQDVVGAAFPNTAEPRKPLLSPQYFQKERTALYGGDAVGQYGTRQVESYAGPIPRNEVKDRLIQDGVNPDQEAMQRFGVKYDGLNDDTIVQWAKTLDDREITRAQAATQNILRPGQKVEPYTLADVKRFSDQAWRESSEWLKDTPVVKTITQKMRAAKFEGAEYFEAKPMETLAMLFDPRRTKQANQILGLLKENGKADLFYAAYAKHLSNRIEREAFTPGKSALSSPTLNVGAINKIFESEKDFMKAVLPESYERFREIAILDKSAGRELGYAEARDKTAQIMGGASLSGLYFAPGTTTAANVTGAAMAWAVVGRNWFSRFLKSIPGLAARAGTVQAGTEYAVQSDPLANIQRPIGQPSLTMGGNTVNLR